jgi:hypothetical protein
MYIIRRTHFLASFIGLGICKQRAVFGINSLAVRLYLAGFLVFCELIKSLL